MAPLCESLVINVRKASRPVALAQAVLCGEPVSNRLFRNAAMARHVDDLVRRGGITHIVAFSGQMAQYLPADFDGPVLMDFVDVDSAKFATYAEKDKSQPLNWVHAREAAKLGAFEADVGRKVDASLFVSEAEAALFRVQSGLGADKVRAIENGIDTERFDPASQLDAVGTGAGPLAVFTGQMDYRPNIDAVRWFAADTLPLIRTRHPEVRFAIVGRAPTDEVRALERLPGVTVTGEVPDVRPWLAAAATGIDATPGEHMLVADGAAAMADAVCRIFDDRTAAAKMGQAARARMIARYGWDARLAPLGDLLGLPA